MKKGNLKFRFLLISLTILGLSLSWATSGLAKNNTQAVAAKEFFADSPFGVNNPFRGWDNKLKDTNYKDKVIKILRELGVGWVTDSAYRKKVEKLNRKYINKNGHTNKNGEIFFSSLPPYDNLVKTRFETVIDDLVDAYEKAGAKMLFVINPKTKWQIKETNEEGNTKYQLLKNPMFPETDIDYSYYKEYLRRLVGRYGNRVAGWFIFNEPRGRYFKYFMKKGYDREKAHKAAVENYAKLVEITYPIIKGINPDAVVILGGASSKQEVDFHADVLAILQDKKNKQGSPLYGTGGFDVWDFHTYALASEYKKIWVGNRTKAWESAPKEYAKYKEETYRYCELYSNVLNYCGFDNKPLITKEGGTYTGENPYVEKPGGSGRKLLLQDEADQAAFLVKRAIHLLSNGVKLINWSTILEHRSNKNQPHNFFYYIGLIYNGEDNGKTPDPPGDFVPKLSFYTYKFLIDKLKDADWNSFHLRSSYPVLSNSNFDVSVYEFKNKKDETKFAAWVDYYHYNNAANPPTRLELQLPVTVSIKLPDLAGKQVKITKAIPNAEKVFQSSIESVSKDGVIGIEFNKEPVYIELKQS